ncbi:glycosyltransferase family 4 protein [Winogradskyella tangerina]|uniref:glycosyltransferase family 4 protein n=1 Tax=Winogradskyella tangerina TaxID=2023240 RepID=UPI001E63CAF1|nr:glycosyltransferase family 4 protein [Winogradskyella tangerina]
MKKSLRVIRVLQIIDTLHTGGAERLAVNYANGLIKHNVESHLCATRAEGPLLNSINGNVNYLFLDRKSTFDLKAIFRLRAYVRSHKIDIIHAHASSFFIATLIKVVVPRVKLIWHDHYGNSEYLDQRPIKVLKWCSSKFSQIFSVNKTLESWAKKTLNCDRVTYIKNFPVLKKSDSNLTKLEGKTGKRILCLANLREQKNHIRLLEAFKLVKAKYPDWTLHCVGKDFKDDYSKLFFLNLKNHSLENHVYFYDTKTDILNILQQSTMAILPSKSEGLPLALLEYGLAGLPVICTDVGDCGKVISDETYGILLKEEKPDVIAEAISKFIEEDEFRINCGKNLNQKVLEEYSEEAILGDIKQIYLNSI